MTSVQVLMCAVLASAQWIPSVALAEQKEPAQSFADLSMPSPEVVPQESYVRAVARSAYVWGWPMINMLNRRARITQAPHPGLLGGVLPAAPRGQIGMLHDYIEPSQRFIACPNQDAGLR
jgi:hypothetical protein